MHKTITPTYVEYRVGFLLALKSPEHTIRELCRTPCMWVTQNTLYGSYIEHPIRELRRTPCTGVTQNTLYGSYVENPVRELRRTPCTGVTQTNLYMGVTQNTLYSSYAEDPYDALDYTPYRCQSHITPMGSYVKDCSRTPVSVL